MLLCKPPVVTAVPVFNTVSVSKMGENGQY